MPIFEYECSDCGRRTEHLQLSSDLPLTACPGCGGEVSKLMSAPAFQFKGSGWYVTDYADKKGGGKSGENGGGAGAGDSNEAGSKSGSDSAKADTSSNSKADSGTKSSASTSSPSD